MADESITDLHAMTWYIQHPKQLPASNTARWFVLSRIRHMARTGELKLAKPIINNFMAALPEEHRLALLVDMVETWAALGAESAMYQTLKKVVGL
jgi:hypothetical protein